LHLKALPGKMAFDQEVLTVSAGKSVSLLFDNSDQMPHNIVVVKPGNTEKVGTAADGMASLADGYEKQFVPDMPEVLFATPLVNAGETYQLDFAAPDAPGDYPFICTFPGHWRIMQGILKVQ
uniref:plastocyanin/azurin family copper-binding protein n=1 Tax=Parapedobacter pyrenivorans TaxID=1305674 RepID=UPI0033420C5C